MQVHRGFLGLTWVSAVQAVPSTPSSCSVEKWLVNNNIFATFLSFSGFFKAPFARVAMANRCRIYSVSLI
jgi:hypothetical protein